MEFQTCRSTPIRLPARGCSTTTPVQGAGSGWFIVGGTSLASPALAGIVNAAGSKLGSSQAELNLIYNNLAITTDFNDIKTDFCGPTAGFVVEVRVGPLHRNRERQGQDREIGKNNGSSMFNGMIVGPMGR